MLQGVEATGGDHRLGREVHDEWDVYLRIHGGNLLALAAAAAKRTGLLRGPERAFYGQVEFEVADPDGHRICVGEVLAAEADVPTRKE
jgi:catechol 2,3-dioxygenase-like lactoylglutathione lyase family enzyme